jgi:glucose-1-phosphate cytidylyltransferase
VIKRFAREQLELRGDLRVDEGGRRSPPIEPTADDWTPELIETAGATQTGGRVKRLAPVIGCNPFFLTWGDGLADVDLQALLAFHRAHRKIATLTAVRPPVHGGHVHLEDDAVTAVDEPPMLADRWINGAFFVLEPEVFDYIDGDATPFERGPLRRLAREGQLKAYRRHDFWQCMDTPRDRDRLERSSISGKAPWIVAR